MIINEEQLDIESGFDLCLIAPEERIIFLDIETTGLSREYSQLYLIAALCSDGGVWTLRQFFAEDPREERLLIRSLSELIRSRSKQGRAILIGYNSDGFDLPFLRAVSERLGEPLPLGASLSLDLYRKLKPYRRILGTDDLKLRTVMRAAGLVREDEYGGGELIQVYREYLRLPETSRKDELLRMLLLHNAEDTALLPFILGVLGYEYLMKGDFSGTENAFVGDVWDIRARLRCPLLRGIYLETDDYVLSIGEEDRFLLNLTVRLYRGELKYFFADYKEYYYLPQEDAAYHKSASAYVERKARVQATAATCYQRKEGFFVPEPEPLFGEVFRTGPGSRPIYGDIGRYILGGGVPGELCTAFVTAVLRDLLG